MYFLRKNENLITIFILFLAFLYSVFSFMGYYYQPPHAINSDSIQLATIFKDLVLGDGKWSDWYFSAAPYFFPDMIIWFILNFFISSFYYTFICYFLIQQFLLFIAIYLLTRELRKNNVFILSSIIFIFVLHYSILHFFAFLPVHHVSEFIFGIFWLTLAIKILKNNHIIYMVLFFLLATLLKLSDNIFVLHFMLPFIVSVIFLRIFSFISTKQCFIFLGLVVASYLLGAIIYKLMMPINTQVPMKFWIKTLLGNINEIINILTATTKITIFSIIFIFSILGFIFVSLSNTKQKSITNIEMLLFLFAIFACAGIFVHGSHKVLPINQRYLFSIVCIPVIISLIYILPRKFYLLILVFLSILAPDYNIFRNFKLHTSYSTHISDCVDELTKKYNIKYGVSEYWDSKIINAISDIKMAQINNNLSNNYFVTTKNFFRDKYDFIIINPNATYEEKIIEINGKPNEKIICGDSKILYYKNGLYTDEFLAKKVVHFDINTGLKNNIGKVFDNVIISNNKTGFLSFGPHKEIPAGKYKFDLIYSSSLSPDEISGFWDINLIVKKNHTIIQKGNLAGTNSEFKTLSAQFETKEKAEIEIRSFYNGKGELKIKELVLYKID